MGLVILPLFIGIAYFTSYPLSQLGQNNHLSQKLGHDQYSQNYFIQKQPPDIRKLKYGPYFQPNSDGKYQRGTFSDLYKLLIDNQRITNDILELVFNRYNLAHSYYLFQPNHIDFASKNFYKETQELNKATPTKYVSGSKYVSTNVVPEENFDKTNPSETVRRKSDYSLAYIEQNPAFDQSKQHPSENYKYQLDDTEQKTNYIKHEHAHIQYEEHKNQDRPKYVNEDELFVQFTPDQEHDSVHVKLEEVNDKKSQNAIKYTQEIDEQHDNIRNMAESYVGKPNLGHNNHHSIKVENSQPDDQIVYVKEEPESYYVTYSKQSDPIGYKLGIGDHEPGQYQSAHDQNVKNYDNIAISYNKDNDTNDRKDIIMPH